MKQRKQSVLHITRIKIPPSGIHLIVKAKINNRIARLVLDTGASQTVLDKNRIERFTKEKKFRLNNGKSSGIGSNSIKSHLFNARNFKIGDCSISDFELVLLDMVHVNNSYGMIGKLPVDGVLGGDVLSKFNAVIDYKKQELILSIN